MGQIETLPHILGIRVKGGDVHVLLKRDTQLPATASWIFSTTEQNQKRAQVHLFAGEGPSSTGRWLLASLNVEPLPEFSMEGLVQLEVTVVVEAWGLISCYVVEAESRALGQDHAEDYWSGALSDSPGDSLIEFSKDEIQARNHSEVQEPKVLQLGERHVQLAGGRRIVVAQEAWGLAGDWETGGTLWDAAVVLADFIIRQNKSFSWPGKRVLELGAGTGLVTIALAQEKASMVATQSYGRSCELLLNNAEKNMNTTEILSSNLRCDILRWSSSEDVDRIASEGPWDFIVGSDLVFPSNAEVSSGVLLQLLSRVASNRTQVLIAMQEREGVIGRFLARVRQTDWAVNLMPAESNLSVDAAAYLKQNGSNKSGHQRKEIQMLHLKRPASADSQAPRPSTTLAASK